jgi:hypothetical protein
MFIWARIPFDENIIDNICFVRLLYGRVSKKVSLSSEKIPFLNRQNQKKLVFVHLDRLLIMT